ncbi:MAG: cysteine peptidase family C39 domain-containing protein [Armatimonadetes bacterium]|nr:cysteine peptidase family C39 domain-containing protein [Armatimonadota bacterium]
MRSLPEYQKATALFAKGDKAGARLVLETLLKTPNLSATDTAFLKTQIGIIAPLTPASRGDNKEIPAVSHVRVPREARVVGLGGNCGPRALAIAAGELGVKADVAALSKSAGTDANGTNLEGLVKAAKTIGLKAEGVQMDRDALARLSTPAVAWWEGNHFVAVLKVSENAFTGKVSATIHDPNEKEAKSVPLDKLLAQSGGILLVLKK